MKLWNISDAGSGKNTRFSCEKSMSTGGAVVELLEYMMFMAQFGSNSEQPLKE